MSIDIKHAVSPQTESAGELLNATSVQLGNSSASPGAYLDPSTEARKGHRLATAVSVCAAVAVSMALNTSSIVASSPDGLDRLPATESSVDPQSVSRVMLRDVKTKGGAAREAAFPLVPLAVWVAPPAIAGAFYISEQLKDSPAPSLPDINLPDIGGGGPGRGPDGRWIRVASFAIGANVARHLNDNGVIVELYGPGDEPDINGRPPKSNRRDRGSITIIISGAGVQNRFRCMAAFNQSALLDGRVALQPSAINRAAGGTDLLCSQSLRNVNISQAPYVAPKRVQTIKKRRPNGRITTSTRRVKPLYVQRAPVAVADR